MSVQTLQGKIHEWIYVIIPLSMNTVSAGGELPVFCAFCKACRQYFTQTVPWQRNSNEGRMSPSDLPRYGCEPISDDVSLLQSLANQE